MNKYLMAYGAALVTMVIIDLLWLNVFEPIGRW